VIRRTTIMMATSSKKCRPAKPRRTSAETNRTIVMVAMAWTARVATSTGMPRSNEFMGESVNAMTDSDGTENLHKTKQPSSAGSVGSSGGSKPPEEEVAHYLGVEVGLYVESGRRAGPNQLDLGAVTPEKLVV
jgi:hypothetical protein